MEEKNLMEKQNETKYQEKGGVDLKNNSCCDCKEGCVLGDKVYCSLDGRFHSLRDDLVCKSFIRK